ncbi:hypothetical protein MHBO_000330 [Bonamia ostreae]|uniref:Elongation Factor G domain-containing protein n=1 Tax=Bonamia ostreae TaxID=126728 RepID=A0ABV2AF82_9EUKA
MKGPYIHKTDEVFAGNIFGFKIQENLNLNEHPIFSENLNDLQNESSTAKTRPVYKVELSTENKQNGEKLKIALKNLMLCDPSLKFSHEENGRLMLFVCGEIHLQVIT